MLINEFIRNACKYKHCNFNVLLLNKHYGQFSSVNFFLLLLLLLLLC